MKKIVNSPLGKVEINCGDKTCNSKEGHCKYLGHWDIYKSYESPWCCELFWLKGCMPRTLDCYNIRHPYRICKSFEVKKVNYHLS